mmetsp:Transcript_27900/g.60564  ORF Transcript_27900/g.60564 Transcript_27900/m.60564 type:complete len:357 (-) Transcript_27900:21-1091(-)
MTVLDTIFAERTSSSTNIKEGLQVNTKCDCGGSRAWRRGFLCQKKREWLGLEEDVPSYQRRDFIRRYYRTERPRLSHFFWLHNEWGNIWTHIASGLYMLYRFYLWLEAQLELTAVAEPPLFSIQNMSGVPFATAATQTSASATASASASVRSNDDWLRLGYAVGVAAFYIGSLLVFFVSGQYHWRMCAKEREFHCWRCLDQSGCLFVVAIGYFAGIPIGFHCFPFWRSFYMALAVSVCLLMAGVFASKAGNADHISYTIILGSLVAFLPAMHWLFLSKVGREAIGFDFTMSMLSAVIAVCFFCKMAPECWAPGRFDLFFNSHQWWHIFIFITILKYSECLSRVYALTGQPELFCGA